MIEFAVRRPIAVLMICIGLAVLGWIAAQRIHMQLLPNMVSPEFTVITTLRGATPEEVETQVTTPLERALSTVAGLQKTDSYSVQARSEIRLTFNTSIDFLETVSLLRERLDSVGLPEGSTKPKLVRFQSNSEPVIRLALTPAQSSVNMLELSKIAQELLIRKLEATEGVALATLIGAPSRAIEVVLDPVAVLHYGIQPTSIPDLIQSRNRTHSGGEIRHEGKKTSIRLGQGLKSLAELKEIIVKKEGSRAIRLGEIARLQEVEQPPAVRPHLQAADSLLIEIRKESEANSVEVANRAKMAIQEFLSEQKENVSGVVLFDQGNEIQTAIDGVTGSVISGGILAALVIFVLLQNAWPSFIITLSIPLSLLLTLILMYFTGITFNIMSLAGLALGVGMLVDNSTLVLESINQEKLKLDDSKEAAVWGTQKISSALIGSTLTTIAVFGPLVLVEGPIGQIFKDLAATVIFAMASSLFVALIVIPMLCSIQRLKSRENEKQIKEIDFIGLLKNANYLAPTSLLGVQSWVAFQTKTITAGLLLLKWVTLRASKETRRHLSKISSHFSIFSLRYLKPTLSKITGGLLAIEGGLSRKIPEILANSKHTKLTVVGLTALGIVLLGAKGAEIVPDEGMDRIVYDLEFSSGQTLQATEIKLRTIEQEFLKIMGVISVSSVSGERGSNQARVVLTVGPDYLKHVLQQGTLTLSRIPALEFNRVKEGYIGQGKPVQLEVYQDDLKLLKTQTKKIVHILEETPGLIEVETDLKPDASEVNIAFSKNKLAWYGADSQAFISTLKAFVMGQGAGILPLGGDEMPLRVVIRDDYLTSVDKIRSLGLTLDQKKIYLNQISDVREQKVPGSIHHLNRKRIATVAASLDGIDIDAANRRIQSRLDRDLNGEKINWKFGSQDEEMKKTRKSLMIAVLLSVFLIYLLLAAQFEDLIQPAIALCAVPLCICGVAVALTLFDMKISAMVFVGFIILIGQSISTSLVMVDFANQLRADGKDLKTAITEATVKRVKPILVTTATNILGLVPMAFATDPGSAMQRPLAVTMIGGLISSTLLTLVAIPIIYCRFTPKREIGND